MRRPGVIWAALQAGIFLGSVSAEENVYHDSIKPVLDRKCVACHACFDAPCQLVLTHYDGLARGASGQPVYNAMRVRPGEPTRLFIDAHSIAEWRDKGFFSVLPDFGVDASPGPGILQQLVSMRDAHAFKQHERLPESTGFGLQRSNTCTSADNIDDYMERFPHGGMPLGAPGLTTAERATLSAWIASGAPHKPRPVQPTTQENAAIQRWETFLNQPGKREQLVARWLYEHLFMAHLHFTRAGSKHFFRLVRSSTPPGKQVKIIASRRPNDEAGSPFFYRLQPVHDTIVYKTHITFALDDALLKKVNDTFLGGNWKLARLPGYAESDRSNPFQTFSAIPVEARYRFMLEHAEYFVRTFIRGPVCHGQIATDVIRDQFWVFFQEPASDLYVSSPQYRKKVTPLMDIAGVEQDLLDGAATWLDVRDQYAKYSSLRQQAYDDSGRDGAAMQDIWGGDGNNSNALLTVFRHHNNASVTRGLVGDYPLTLWWMDFPMFERGYYNLVVNFDVFGTLAHQAQVRLYFDLIRNDAERNFLRLMPVKSRQPLIDSWYKGAAQLKLMTSYQDISDRKPPLVDYDSDMPKHAFTTRLLKDFAHLDAPGDPVNRAWPVYRPARSATAGVERTVKALRRITSVPASRLPAVSHFPETAFIRVYDSDGHREIYTVMRNRMHSNVAFLFAEDLRLEPEQDTLSISPGVLSSYPNFMFNVSVDDVDAFADSLLKVRDEVSFTREVVNVWGVRRTHPQFWDLFHEASAYLETHSPVEAGILDMSRYENL